MNRLAVSSVVLIILQSTLSVFANVKITPIGIESKSKADLKVEEARYQNPITPEYYGNSFDRTRDGFVTSNYNSYAGGLSNYDRYGSSAYDKYGSNYDRYGSQWNRDRTGSNFGINSVNPLTNKFNYMPGGVYGANAGSYGGSAGAYGNSYGGGLYGNNRPYDGYGSNRPYDGQVNGPYPGQAGPMMPGGFGGDFEGKSSLILPLAGAALLGIAAYTLVANPGLAMAGGPSMYGKRRKRSLFDQKLEQHLVYRAHQNKLKQKFAKSN